MIPPRQSTWVTEEPQSVTFVELFFDLVFVYAITQITSLLRHDLSLEGVGHSLLVLWLVWWAWTQFTWTLNPADTEHDAVRLFTLTAAGSAFFMAQAVPDAFGDGSPWFAISYVVVRLLGLGLQVEATWRTEYFAGTRVFLGISAVGLLAVVAGAFFPSPGREIAWSLAIAIDIVSAVLAGRRTWSINAAHFAERHGLIIIIALGESLIAAGIAVAGVQRGAEFAVGALAAVALVSAAWWIYFGSTMEVIQGALEAAPPERRGGVGRDLYSFGHLPILAGIIAIAVPVEEVLAHPDEPLVGGAAAALAVGVLLYVLAVAWARRHASGDSTVWAALALVVVVGALVVVLDSSGLLTLGAVAVALVAYGAVSAVTGSRA